MTHDVTRPETPRPVAAIAAVSATLTSAPSHQLDMYEGEPERSARVHDCLVITSYHSCTYDEMKGQSGADPGQASFA